MFHDFIKRTVKQVRIDGLPFAVPVGKCAVFYFAVVESLFVAVRVALVFFRLQAGEHNPLGIRFFRLYQHAVPEFSLFIDRIQRTVNQFKRNAGFKRSLFRRIFKDCRQFIRAVVDFIYKLIDGFVRVGRFCAYGEPFDFFFGGRFVVVSVIFDSLKAAERKVMKFVVVSCTLDKRQMYFALVVVSVACRVKKDFRSLRDAAVKLRQTVF